MTMLAGLWNYGGRPAARDCRTMLRVQGAAGDPVEVAEGEGIALGRTVRDPLEQEGRDGGPIAGASGALTLLADVRLDNRSDLLSRLGLTGPAWAACSDARLMMLCFEQWGESAIDGFVGDFALALWDRRSERLVLARDFAGQRPLFYCETDRALAFASMARGLHALDLVPRAVDRTRMMEVLAGLPHRGRGSFFEGIARVEPGEAVAFRRGARDSRIFWSPPRDELRLGSAAEYAEALTEKLDQAVESRLRGAGGAVGTHLSAGLDSSAVTASAALRFDGRVVAFTSVPSGSLPPLPDGRFGDEGDFAAETAALYANVEHRRIPAGTRIPIETLGRQLELYERADLNLPNIVWADRINDEAAAAGIRVMLVGTSGNTTISYGGPEVLSDLLAEGRIGRFLAESLAAGKAGFSARTLLGVAARHFLPRPLLRALGRLRHREKHPGSAGALNPSAAGATEIIARYERNETRSFASSVDARIHALRRVDFGTYNKGVLMRWGIELSDPTADRRLVEFCLRVPLHQYFRNGTPRALIRTALIGRIPESVRLNRLRGLQAANWHSLLARARPEMKELLAAIRQCEAVRDLLDFEQIENMLESLPSEPENYGSMAYRYGLLRGLSAGEFIRIYSAGGD